MKSYKSLVLVLILMALQILALNGWCTEGVAKTIHIIYTGRTWGQLKPCPS